MLSLDLRTNPFWKIFFHGNPPVLFFALMQFQLGVTTEELRILISKLSGHFLDNFFNSLIITYTYIMYLSFVCPVSSPPPPLVFFLRLLISLWLSSIRVPHSSMGCGLLTEAQAGYQWPHHWRKWLTPTPPSPQLLRKGAGLHEPLSHPWWTVLKNSLMKLFLNNLIRTLFTT